MKSTGNRRKRAADAGIKQLMEMEQSIEKKGRIQMNTKTMEGLIGARTNMNLMDVPIRVYKEARLKNDLATMKRSMDYAGQFSAKAWEYEEKADEGMKEEAKEEREKAKEKAKKELEEAIEKRREERKAEAEEQTVKTEETKESGSDVEAETEMEPVKTEVPDKKPVFYSSTGNTETFEEQCLGTNVSASV